MMLGGLRLFSFEAGSPYVTQSALNSRSSWLSFPGFEITCVHHHVWLLITIFSIA